MTTLFHLDEGNMYWLVGCVYFQANRASLHQHASNPIELFDSIEASTVFEHHSKFLSIIRRASWQGAYEHTLLPSDTALSFHLLRSCWVSQVWGSALQPIFEYPDLKIYGWHYENDSNKVRYYLGFTYKYGECSQKCTAFNNRLFLCWK